MIVLTLPSWQGYVDTCPRVGCESGDDLAPLVMGIDVTGIDFPKEFGKSYICTSRHNEQVVIC
jgi:hypothetical protein